MASAQTQRATLTPEHRRQWALAHRILFGFGLVAFENGDTDYRLWEAAVADLDPATLVPGAKAAADFSGTWFKISDFKGVCRGSHNSKAPDPYLAYTEACNAPSPKDAQAWSHPAVYHAGAACGWGYLASTPERDALPRYRAYYTEMLKRAGAGENLELPVTEMIEHQPDADPEGRRKAAEAGHARFRASLKDWD